MKKRNLIKTALLSSALLLGTGYAVINNRVLTATGTVPIATKELDVKITDIHGEPSDSEKNISDDGHTLTFICDNMDVFESGVINNDYWIYLEVTNYDEFNVDTKSTITVTAKNGEESVEYYTDTFYGGIFDNAAGSNLIEYIEPDTQGYIEFAFPIELDVLNYSSLEITITVEAFPVFE
jgi:hypothetical protein